VYAQIGNYITADDNNYCQNYVTFHGTTLMSCVINSLLWTNTKLEYSNNWVCCKSWEVYLDHNTSSAKIL